jgi:CheY-like chemotaxis protein
VSQLGGKISIRSELGKGSHVEVLLPLEISKARLETSTPTGEINDRVASAIDAQEALKTLRSIASGKTVAIWRNGGIHNNSRKRTSLAWDCLEKYCSSWFGFNIVPSQDLEALQKADLIIMEKYDSDFSGLILPFATGSSRILLIREGISSSQTRKSKKASLLSGSIWTPIGPYKLARSINALFAEEVPTLLAGNMSTAAQATPQGTSPNEPLVPGTPEQRDIINLNITPPDLELSMQETPTLPAQQRLLPPKRPSSDTSSQVEQAITSLKALLLDSSPAEAAEAPLHVLAVDDNALNLQLLSRYLMKRRIDTVVKVCNGTEAVAAVRDSEKPFDLIFMDISMPEMDGFEATRLIRQHERNLMTKGWDENPDGLPASIKLNGDNVVGNVEADVIVDVKNMNEKERKAGTGNDPETPEEQGWEPEGETQQVAQEPVMTPTNITGTNPTPIPGMRTPVCIVALTGLATRKARDEAQASGFDDFLTKPISFSKIGELLRRMSKEKAAGLV